MVTGAILKGFQLGVSLIEKPFRYAGGAFVERMQDEMSDISSAGSMFAIDKRDKTGVFKSFEDARGFQEELNARLARSASALPGATSDYVAQAKQLTDDMMLTYSQNKKSFVEFAKTLGPVKDERDALGLVLQKFTEKAVLLGKGSGGSSAYGIPQILSMLLNQDRVNVNAFRQFAAYQSNPLFKNALEKAGPELAKTAKGSAERLKLIQKILDEAVPNEVVQAMKNSMDGVKEAIRSGFLDPETGLFGLGRKLAITVPKVDALGRYLDKNGKVTSDVSKAMADNASIFSLLRDSIGGFVLPLSELVSVLPQIFDPLTNIAEGLVKFRGIAQRFYKNFNQYTADFELMAKNLADKGFVDAASKIKSTAGARGALLTFADLLTGIGAFTEGDWASIATQLKDPNVNLSTVAKKIFDTLLSSDFMRTVGETIGGLFGSVVSALGSIMSGATDMAKAGPFAAGLKKGWDEAGGSLGVSMIFKSVFSLIGAAILGAFKAAPLETSALAAFTVGMPLLSGIITTGITSLFLGLGGGGAAAAGGGAAAAGGGAAAAGGGAAAAGGGALAGVALPVAAVAGVVLFQDQLISMFKQFGKWGDELKESTNLAAVGFSILVKGLAALGIGLVQIFSGLWDMIVGMFTGNTQKIKSGFVRLFNGIATAMGGLIISVIGVIAAPISAIVEATKNLFLAIWEGVRGIHPSPHGDTWFDPNSRQTKIWNGKEYVAAVRYNGGLGDAISSEMRNKPSGSNLVIANSSETIIPAAGGLGMKELFRTLDERSMGTINAPITIHQQPGQNAEQLAALVAVELGNAIRHSRASSVYV